MTFEYSNTFIAEIIILIIAFGIGYYFGKSIKKEEEMNEAQNIVDDSN